MEKIREGDKPTILIIDAERARDPLLIPYYNYLARLGGPLNIIWDRRVNTPIEEIVKDRLGGVVPNYVYWGFSPGTGLTESSDYVKSNDISIIVSVGDVVQFVGDYKPISQNFEKLHVKYLILHWRELEGYHLLEKIRAFMNKKKALEGSEIIYVPWGINPEMCKDCGFKRDIDVSQICTINCATRKVTKEVIENMGDRINVRTGDWWGDEYIEILFRSKIFVVDGANRDFMVQKYIEGPACGAMLLGEIPSTARDIFVDGVSIGEVKDYSTIDKKIMYYLEHDDERVRIAKEGQRRIIQHCTIDKITKDFENTIVNDWGGNKGK